MRSGLFPAALLLACGGATVPAVAQSPAPAPASGAVAMAPAVVARLPEYQQAAAALRDKLPEVAVVKLKRVLDSGKLKAGQLPPVRLLLAEALVRAGRPAEAVEVSSDKEVLDLPEGKFWQAQALARLNRWREAEVLFESLGGLTGFRYAGETAFSRAGLLAALGEADRAGKVLQPLVQAADAATASKARLWQAELRLSAGSPAEAAALLDDKSFPAAAVTPERDYLKGRIALESGDYESADRIFAALTKTTAAPPRLQQAARLGRTRALRMQGKQEEALSLLRPLLPVSPLPPPEILDATFQELDALNQPPGAEIEALLKGLVAGAEPAYKIRARISLAAATEAVAEPPQVIEAWASIVRDFPGDPLRAVALLRQAQFLTAQGRRPEALPLLADLRRLAPSPAVAAWSTWVAGQGAYDAEAYRKAAANFIETATTAANPAVRAAAAYNAALAELQGGNANPARSLALLDGSPLDEYRMAGAEFHLERALRMASLGETGAIQGLEAFAANLPDHPRHFDALIALAEIALRSLPPRLTDASQHLEAAAQAAREPWQKERVALLDCYIAEAAPGPVALSADAFLAKAGKFLTAFPQSAARSDLRMKAAQLLYRRENFSGARRMFEALEADDPLHPLAEPALFWAGRAALLTMEPSADQQAMALWEKVVDRNGPLKWQARLMEARLNQRQRKAAAALQLLDEILAPAATPAPEASTRWQALSLRGEILAAPGMLPAEQAQGLKAFDEVIASEGLPAAWRHQSLVRKGVCLEALDRPDEALEAYYDVLSDPPAALPEAEGGAPDDYWFHRAGGKALNLLEKARKIEEAIEIAKKLAKTPGPRGRAAAELVDELALKYKIWTASP